MPNQNNFKLLIELAKRLVKEEQEYENIRTRNKNNEMGDPQWFISGRHIRDAETLHIQHEKVMHVKNSILDEVRKMAKGA